MRVVMVSALLAVSLVFLGAGVAGCGGGEPAHFTTADARRLANVRPVTPGWSPWPQRPEKRPRSDSSPEEAAAKDPIYAAYRRRTAEIEQQEGSDNRWVDDDKLGHLVVQPFGTAADAHVSFLASNDLSRAYGATYWFVVKAENVDGLGDEAWRLWVEGNGRQVTYHWRRDNLVTEVHVHCYGDCGPDLDTNVDAAARASVDAVDKEARSTGGQVQPTLG